MVCLVCMWNVKVYLLHVVPSFTRWSTISLPINPTCALIFLYYFLCLVHEIWWTMVDMSNLLGGSVEMRGI